MNQSQLKLGCRDDEGGQLVSMVLLSGNNVFVERIGQGGRHYAQREGFCCSEFDGDGSFVAGAGGEYEQRLLDLLTLHVAMT